MSFSKSNEPIRPTGGEFGEIVYAGIDWVDPALARRSMELMPAR